MSSIIAIIVALSFFCVYYFNYNITYSDMLKTLHERSDSIYSFVEKSFDKRSFGEVKTRDSIHKDIYIRHREILEAVKEATGVKYLYTATKNEEGDFVYVLDGLPMDSYDFRYPGDPIEEEIISDLELAMNNQIVYPDDILATDWGEIFISYYPIHDGTTVIGVIGIEFDASSQYEAFSKIRVVTPIIGSLFAVIAILLSIFLFRRISNPSYKSMFNTDYLTGLKNRNAFELFIGNMKVRDLANLGFISVDLNNLKVVNDTYGHKIGDSYIVDCSELLTKVEKSGCSLYRVGGDEFVFIYTNTKREILEAQIAMFFTLCETHNAKAAIQLSAAMGYALYDSDIDTTAFDIYNRADENMYKNKRCQKGI